MEQILVYYLGQTWQQMSDVGECLDTASRIKAGDDWSWPREWESTARRLQKLAESSEARGRLVSAGQAYLRASNYYVASLHRHRF